MTVSEAMSVKHRFYCEALTAAWPAGGDDDDALRGGASNAVDSPDDVMVDEARRSEQGVDETRGGERSGARINQEASAESLSDVTVELSVEESKHARRVLRLREGDAVELFDGCGRVATGRIVGEDRAVRVALESARREARASPWIELCVAMPKGSRADGMVDQLSQLGADRLLPLRSSRSVVDPRPGKLERFRKTAIESAKQCGRAWVMEIGETTDYQTALATEEGTLLLLADRDGEAMDADRTRSAVRAAGCVRVLIGPEGGWTDEEAAAAREAGCLFWRLGPHVLRIETAAVAATALLRTIGNA